MAISQQKTTNHTKLAQMPSKLRKAIGAVKDQTSISLAKVSRADTVNIEISILKATSHDDAPIDNRHLEDILQSIARNRAHAAACAQAIAKRVGKTRNWIVALKSLVLVLRIFQEGDPHFPKEVRKVMKMGAKILNLSNFRDDSNSRPWDYTSFVRAFALYLDERLDCLLSGKLHRLRRCSYGDSENSSTLRAKNSEPVNDMKPSLLIDRVFYWQKLLDRTMAATPTGEAATNRLVRASLYAVVQESFELYRDVSEGLALLLDSFFHLQYQSCVNAFQACVRASKQFEELTEFYGHCKSIGVGRTSEYPSVQKVSGELIETLQEFLKDQASFPCVSSTEPTVVVDQTLVSTSTEPNSACTDSTQDYGEHRDSIKVGSESVSFVCQGKEEENPRNDAGWEAVLANNTVTELPVLQHNDESKIESDGPGYSTLESLFSQESQWNNPFLQEKENDLFFEREVGPTFRAEFSAEPLNDHDNGNVAPTFCAQNPEGNDDGVDPFELFGEGEKRSGDGVVTCTDGALIEGCEEIVMREQQLWLENQKKIIAKRIDGLTFDSQS